MEKQEQREKEAEEAINAINKKTGRNMPQAIATAVVLIAIILACLLISVDLFVYLVVLFMVLALWELRVDFATAGLHIPVVALWACSANAMASPKSLTISRVIKPPAYPRDAGTFSITPGQGL